MGRFKGITNGRSSSEALGLRTADKIVLGGRIVTMDSTRKVLPSGYVCIEGHEISAVVADRAEIPPGYPLDCIKETGGTIYPGLIALHDHPPYDILPLWKVPGKYRNRNKWIKEEPKYLPDISWPAQVVAFNKDEKYRRAVARYVECRSLCGGATTFQGVSKDGDFYRGLARNVENSRDSELTDAIGRVPDFLPADVANILVPALKRNGAYFYHLSEGTDPDARQRFLDLEYAPGQWAINNRLASIHCVGLQQGDFAKLAGGGGTIWSPLSNYMLYGQTMDFAAAKAAGVRLCLGADWGPSGSKNLLAELKVARIASELTKNLFSAADLVAMVTINAAETLGWSNRLGSIEPKRYADLLILAQAEGDPYDQLIDACESDIAAVLVDGQPRLGREHLLEFSPEGQEILLIGTQRYIIDLADDDGSSLGPPSLAEATSVLKDAMGRLPELAREHKAFFSDVMTRQEKEPRLTMLAARGAWGLDLEFEPEMQSLRDYALAAADIDPDLMYPMKLAPLTLVDDPDYMQTVKANNNIPKEILKRL